MSKSRLARGNLCGLSCGNQPRESKFKGTALLLGVACGIPSTLSDLRGFSCWSELRNRQPGCSSVGPHSAGTQSSDAATGTTPRDRSGSPLTGIRSKLPRLKLEPEAYCQLCHEVLERDGWRCQSCGQIGDLQVHHILPRSRLGDDTAENLIALCVICHQKAHRLQQDTE